VNLPNTLTLSRIFIVPLLVVVLLTPLSESLGVPPHILGIALLTAAALTDFFDGRIARRRRQVSKLGKLLDPIADKILISAALIALVENRLAPAWAVVIIVGREFAVTGLRSIAASEGVIISASRMGKFKMVMQVMTVGLLILSLSPSGGGAPVSNFGQPVPAFQFWRVPELRTAWMHLTGEGATTWADWQVMLYTVGRAMLWVVVLSAIYSMWGYFRIFFTTVLRGEKKVPAARSSSATVQSGEAAR
jgi:CDP-diacylglycerol--glycerol-3-phosphate 3-phosphatidyltransferase